MEPLNPDVRFYLSEILNAFGLEDAASELSAPVPAWLAGRPLKLPALDIPAPEGDFETSFVAINKLFAGKSNVRSVVLLDRMCRKFPDNSRSFAGYAIALEKLGAYKAAAAQAAKNMALCKTPERKAAAAAYIADLEHRPQLKYTSSADKPLKGRYLAFLGGSLNRADGGTTYSFSSRAGKFISERLDVSVNAALSGGNNDSRYNGITLGVASRYNEPLNFVPLNGTLAAKMERVPAVDNTFTFLISPGLSYFMPDSSVDLYFDIAFAGPYKKSVTMSLGYTMYFGGSK
jgi:hypothetical protein